MRKKAIYRVYRAAVLVALGLLALELSGCAALSVGKNSFDCPGQPDGKLCVSAHDAYAATADGNVPLPMHKDPETSGAAGQTQPTGNAQATQVRDPVIDDYVAPRIPNRPIPVRTPAKVMRIWVAPWEDKQGNLNVSGYVYTEIEPRKWVIGNSHGVPDPLIQPLQVIQARDTQNGGVHGTGVSRTSSRRGNRRSGATPYSPLPQR